VAPIIIIIIIIIIIKSSWCLTLTTYLHLLPRLWISDTKHPLLRFRAVNTHTHTHIYIWYK
jgi:hypothetical protein